MGMKNPFSRPWVYNNGAASGGGGNDKVLKGIVAGGITGGVEICITYPTEFVKTHLQLDKKKGTGERKYDGVIDCVKKTVKAKGIRGLYRGLSVLLYGSVPKSAVRFGSFESFKKRSVDENGNLSPLLRAFCGLGAGVIESIFPVTPMETIKVKFINDQRSDKPRFRGFFHGVRLILKEHGVKGVYQGLFPTILRQGSNQMVRFFIMETLKDIYRGGDQSVKVPKVYTGVFGFFAGGISVLANNPIDVVKTRMQGLEAYKYKNSLDCILKLLKNEGPLAFYKGTIPRLTRVCLDGAITFTVYDIMQDLFVKIWP